MSDLQSLGRELERRGKTEALKKLAESPDGRRAVGLVDAEAVQKAAKSGDSEALKKALSRLLQSPEGQRLAGEVRKMMED